MRPRVERVQLLNELDLSQEEVQQIAGLVRALVQGVGFVHATHHLRHRFPCTFAAFLVFQGVYGYVEGDYWSAVAYATGLPRETCQRWGRAFLAVMTQLGLPAHFPGHRYVGVILGHAGVPVHALPELFRLLHRAFVDGEQASLPTGELIAHWLETGVVAHKPVQRFLLYGGPLAEIFVERCRQMVRWTFLRTKPHLSADKLAAHLNLPHRVVERYIAWRQGKPIFVPHKYRVRTPYLVLDPRTRGVQVKLPGQLLPHSARAIWKIHIGGEIRLLPALNSSSPYGVKTGELVVSLLSPAERCVVQLFIDRHCVGEWVLLSPPVHWLIFDAQTGRHLALPRRLPARPLWVLWAPGTSLSAHPGYAVPVRAQLPRLSGEWRSWRAFEVHLLGVEELHIHTPRNTHTFSVPVTYPSPRLELVPQSPVLVEVDASGRFPLHVGTPPRVLLSFPNASVWHHFARSFHLWRLELHHESRDTRRVFPLIALLPLHLREKIYRAAGSPVHIEVSLDSFPLVGSAPRGVYTVRLSGPKHFEVAQKTFGIVPHLVVNWQPALCPPASASLHPIELFVEVELTARLQPHPEEKSVRVEQITQDTRVRRYRVQVPPDAPHVRLLLAYPDLLRHPIPIRVRVLRLRWGLAAGASPPARWEESFLTLNFTDLSSVESPTLLVDVPHAVPVTALKLDILASTGRRLLSLWATPGEAGVWRVDLRPLVPLLRGGHWPFLDGELTLYGKDNSCLLSQTVWRVQRVADKG